MRLGDRVVILTLTARADDFDRYAGLWGEVTAGLRWRPGAGLPLIVLRPPSAPPGSPPGDGPAA